MKGEAEPYRTRVLVVEKNTFAQLLLRYLFQSRYDDADTAPADAPGDEFCTREQVYESIESSLTRVLLRHAATA